MSPLTLPVVLILALYLTRLHRSVFRKFGNEGRFFSLKVEFWAHWERKHTTLLSVFNIFTWTTLSDLSGFAVVVSRLCLWGTENMAQGSQGFQIDSHHSVTRLAQDNRCSAGLEQGHWCSLHSEDFICFSSFNQNRRNGLGQSYHQPFSSHNTVSLVTSVAKDGTESSDRVESWSAAAWLRLALQEFMTDHLPIFTKKLVENSPDTHAPKAINMNKILQRYSNIFLTVFSWLQMRS